MKNIIYKNKSKPEKCSLSPFLRNPEMKFYLGFKKKMNNGDEDFTRFVLASWIRYVKSFCTGICFRVL